MRTKKPLPCCAPTAATDMRSQILLARGLRTGTLLAICFTSSVALCGPIHDAARKGDQNKVVALLAQNPELVFSRDNFGNTPLHLAALHNRPAVAALLLANGADVNARNNPPASWFNQERNQFGETPLTLALQSYEHKDILQLLLTHGADPNVMLSDGGTPLHRAVSRDLPDDVELLLANGADPDAKGSNWQSPLLFAVMGDRIKILEILLDYGADPNVKDMAGHTALYYAKTNSHEKAAALLRAHGGQ
jgi:cytohesin